MEADTKEFPYQMEVSIDIKPEEMLRESLNNPIIERTLRKHTEEMQPTKKTPRSNPKSHFSDYKCKICKKSFRDKYGLTNHMHIHTDETFTCDICGFTCKTKKYLARHKKSHMEKELQCVECGMKFRRKSALTAHMRVHTGEKPLECDVCGKTFSAQWSLTCHKYIHTNEKPYKCRYCDYACRDNSTLRKHQEKHEGTEKVYQCKACYKKFKNKWSMKIHVAEVHLEVDVKTHECEICEKKFKSTSSLRYHVNTVHARKNTKKCEICGFVVSNRYNLKAHLLTHVDARPYKCNYGDCKKTYKSSEGLKKHTITHYPSRQFACDICERRFSRRHRMERHLHTHEARVKRCECDHCGARFLNKNYIIKHIRQVHNTRESYMCDLCSFETNNKPSIVMHLKYGHQYDDDRTCKVCNRKFKKFVYLKTHYWRKHSIKYKMVERKKKEKPRLRLKDENDIEIMEAEDLVADIKQERLDDADDKDIPVEYSEAVMSEDVLKALGDGFEVPVAQPSRAADVPESMFDLFYLQNVVPGADFMKKEPKNEEVDRRKLKKNEEVISKLLVDARKKRLYGILERTRRVYNQRVRDILNKRRQREKVVNIRYFNKKPSENTEDEKIEDNAANSDDATVNNEENDDNQSANTQNSDNHNLNTCNDSNQSNNTHNTDNHDINTNNTKNQSVNTQNSDNHNINTNNYNNRNITVENSNNQSVSKESSSEDSAINKNNEQKTQNRSNRRRIAKNSDNHITNNRDEMSDEMENIDEVNKVKKKINKIKLNTHQCYVCFKLFETKDNLLDHCRVHFDICTSVSLKKCPLCEYVSRQNLARHLRLVHDINVKLYGNYKEKKSEELNADIEGSKYYLDITNLKTNIKVDVIPSVRNLNRNAFLKLDRQRRGDSERVVAVKKLVKKGAEWIVGDHKMDLNLAPIPKLQMSLVKNLSGKTLEQVSDGDYYENLCLLGKFVKKKGRKIVYPCNGCEKICLNFAALRLHTRKHDPNKKPFKPKVWKHKLMGNNKKGNGKVKSDGKSDKSAHGKDKVNKSDVKSDESARKNVNGESNVKVDNNSGVNKAHRNRIPNPVANKHKCSPELIEFYNSNVRGGNIEFWQFLKIFNRMDKDEINNFNDIEGHNNPIDEARTLEELKKITDRKKTEKKTKNKFTRVIKLSREELVRRNEIKNKLREKIGKENGRN